jgi:SAM-dependent methyltransferase
MNQARLADFAADYARHRAAEGRAYDLEDLLALPYLDRGPLAGQWAIRARTYQAFVHHVLEPMAEAKGAPLHLVDLGAGNGWLSYRAALAGHRATAIDIREDSVDGLGAATRLAARVAGRMRLMPAGFERIPLDDASADLAVFNASLHYATDLGTVLAEAVRVVRPGGLLAILDTPFYRREKDGLAMVAEKHATARQRFGARADTLLALPFIEFLTRGRLEAASAAAGLTWRRIRVRYPLHYELRPIRAFVRGQRRPSRFDLWTSVRP